MTPTPEELAAQYARMSETKLMELARSYDGLLEVAQTALRSDTQKYVRHVERRPTKQAGFSPGKYRFFETRLSS